MSLLEIRKLSTQVADVVVCRELDLSLEAGQCWGLLGANGAGKTTLLHTLAGLRAPLQGELRLDGRPLASLSRREVAQQLGLLPQDSVDPLPATVLETVLIGRHPFLKPWDWEGAEDMALAAQALAAVDLAAAVDRQVATLSGGERRRLAIATLLAQNPRVYLLDEPSNHLDLRHQISLLTLLRDHAARRDGAILMSLHDLNLAARFCDHLLLLLPEGEVLAGPAAEMLRPEHLQRVYGHPLRVIEQDGQRAFVPA